MKNRHFNSLPIFAASGVKVDREKDTLNGVRIADFGENKNGSFFDKFFLEDLVEQGNDPKGIKCRFGHPNMCSTSFGSFIGRYRNFSLNEVNGKTSVFADLHLDPVSKKTQVEGKGITMYEYIMSMAESNPDMFGNSIHIYSEVFEQEIDGKNQSIHKLEKFKASDLVDDPAATDELFSATDDLGAVVTDFLDNNPKIFDTVAKNPGIIEDFFERYVNYFNRKSLINTNMNFFQKLTKNLASKKDKDDTFDIEITLADGAIVTVVTEAEEPKVDDKIVDDAGAPLADGEYLLPDGGALVVVGGLITEIKEAEEGDGTGEPTMVEVMQAVKDLGTKFNTFATQVKKDQGLNEKAFGLLGDNLTEFQKKTNLALKNVKSSYEAPPGEDGKGGKGKKEGTYDADAVAEARKKIAERKK